MYPLAQDLPIEQPLGNHDWFINKLNIFPYSWQSHISNTYVKIANTKSLFDANTLIRAAHDRLILPKTKLTALSDYEEVRIYTEALAHRLKMEFIVYSRKEGIDLAIKNLINEVEKRDLEFPFNLSSEYEGSDLLSASQRVFDAKWWQRKIQKAQGKIVDQLARELEIVHKNNQVYCDQQTLASYRVSQSRKRKFLERMEAVNENGESVPLSDCVASSIANPELRRTELMVRMRGFEDVANLNGHQGALFTVTAPSKYHPMHSYGRPNVKYKGATPKDTQIYLSRVWQMVRAAWDREGIKAYGFRIVEPHHDGTPHWHLMLFFEPECFHKAVSIFKSYALAEDRKELGSKTQARFDVTVIDPAKGSATGYIAKYISKNIDGYKVDIDYESGSDGAESAERVVAWASTWGIRQFQQLGGPPVGVWRELRRLSRKEVAEQLKDAPDDQKEQILEAHRQADTANWAAYVILMGGPLCRRCDQLLRTALGQETENQYGEKVQKVTGVCVGCDKQIGENRRVTLTTRVHIWTLQPILILPDAQASPWSSGNNCTQEYKTEPG